ncbi:MAG TPA: rhodanese-like domain-containing protein [Acidobacteriaceae bacterium]|jgi:membrane protein DedA with SNARE-associated domain/rhodanese-related sulfurtransferase|nr:rhodanese-like domain-containing protein [Acidobacteriaceae bacterium]
MNLLVAVQHHGYAATAIILFLSACGLPLPISIVLLTAGAAAHGGSLQLGLVILTAAGAALTGDTLLYIGGRTTGWWLLAGLCRVSLNPETCIYGSAHSFYKRGARTLLFSKFVPGLATVAAPLAGSLNMRLFRFLRLDVVGVLFYTAAWSTVGFLFAPFLRAIIAFVERLGHITADAFIGALVLYILWLLLHSLRENRFSSVERVAAQDLHARLQIATHDRVMVIADVRSHGYYDPSAQRIKNSIRVEPNRLREELEALREFMAPECEIYLYCSCARDATSVRVARMLEKENCSTKVIQGGLKAWIKAGGPLEPVPPADVEHLPKFN